MMIYFSFLVGVPYGTTNMMAGHQFDTIKTKMQAQPGFESQGMIKSYGKTLRMDGIKGLIKYNKIKE